MVRYWHLLLFVFVLCCFKPYLYVIVDAVLLKLPLAREIYAVVAIFMFCCRCCLLVEGTLGKRDMCCCRFCVVVYTPPLDEAGSCSMEL